MSGLRFANAVRRWSTLWCAVLIAGLAAPVAGRGQESHEHVHDHDRARPGMPSPDPGRIPGEDSVAPSDVRRFPRTLRVGPGGEYATPAAALAVALPGDTIRVGPGVHAGGLVVDRRLALIADPGAVLDGGGSGSVVTLAADGSALRGFTVRGGGHSLERDDAAVKLVGCEGCAVESNALAGVLHGIYVLESNDVVLAGNDVTGDERLGEARRGNGIHVFSSSGARIEGNRIRRTRDGIYFSFASRAEVIENEVADVRYGLHYMYSNGNYFEGNEFTSSSAGAALMFSDSITFRDNAFRGHVGLRAYGILLQTVRDIVAEGNVVADNRIGVHLDNAQGGRFVGNVVGGNGVGIELLSSSERNTFAGNEIRGNRLAVRQAGGLDDNSWSQNGRGNFWGSGDVFDLDGDGVGDRPFVVGEPFSVLATRRPALEPFVRTPAALAFGWAERAFPVFDIRRAVDPAPLVRSPFASSPAGRSRGTSETEGRRRILLAAVTMGVLGGLVPIGSLHVAARRVSRRRES